MLTILLACLAMAARDGIATLLTVAETRGRAKLAAQLAALSDLASIACTVFGAGEVITHGLTLHTALIVGGMVCTSFVTAYLSTRAASRITATTP